MTTMKNTLRCCISCIFPCGSFDVIRVVHSNGQVEEFSETIRAGDLMKLNPKHVVKRPSLPSEEGVVPKIIIMPREAELQRGKIYFLVPVSSLSGKPRPSRSMTNSKKNEMEQHGNGTRSRSSSSVGMTTKLLISDQYLTEILSEKVSTQRERRRGRIGVWRPHLSSISETTTNL